MNVFSRDSEAQRAVFCEAQLQKAAPRELINRQRWASRADSHAKQDPTRNEKVRRNVNQQRRYDSSREEGGTGDEWLEGGGQGAGTRSLKTNTARQGIAQQTTTPEATSSGLKRTVEEGQLSERVVKGGACCVLQ